jgi:hypothetical protein
MIGKDIKNRRTSYRTKISFSMRAMPANEVMFDFGWRSPWSYQSPQNAKARDIAWECMRQNPD